MARTLFLQHTKMFNLDDTTNKRMAIYFKSTESESNTES